jgi:hypothetical protein
MGIPQLAFKEFNVANMEGFNAAVHNQDKVKVKNFESKNESNSTIQLVRERMLKESPKF